MLIDHVPVADSLLVIFRDVSSFALEALTSLHWWRG